MPVSALSLRKPTLMQAGGSNVTSAALGATVMPAIEMKKLKPTSRWIWFSTVAPFTARPSAKPVMKPRSKPVIPDLKSSRLVQQQSAPASPSPNSLVDTHGAATKGCSPSPEPSTADQSLIRKKARSSNGMWPKAIKQLGTTSSPSSQAPDQPSPIALSAA